MRRAAAVLPVLYTVLVEGDDLADPIADVCPVHPRRSYRAVRELAAQGHYPAIDVLNSVSRVIARYHGGATPELRPSRFVELRRRTSAQRI